MIRSRQNRLLALGLLVAASAGVYEARTVFRQREELATLRHATTSRDTEAATLRRELETMQRDLAEAEQQLSAIPGALPLAGPNEPAHVTEMRAWLARVKRLKQIFADQPDQRIPEMLLLEEVDWLAPTDHPLETEPQLRMAMAQVREAARVRFRPQMSAALRKYQAVAGSQVPASILALAPHFEPPVDQAMLAQYEVVMSTSRSPPTLVFRPRAPVDPIYEYRSTLDANSGGTSGGNPTSWIPDYFERERKAMSAYALAHPLAPQVGLPQLAPYFDPPLPAALVEGYEHFVREVTRPR
jgi:hypothetical protein